MPWWLTILTAKAVALAAVCFVTFAASAGGIAALPVWLGTLIGIAMAVGIVWFMVWVTRRRITSHGGARW
jgi:hypothetical protein